MIRRDLCASAKQGKLCCDDLCHTGGETICGFDRDDYLDMLGEEEVCTCDKPQLRCPTHDSAFDDEEL